MASGYEGSPDYGGPKPWVGGWFSLAVMVAAIVGVAWWLSASAAAQESRMTLTGADFLSACMKEEPDAIGFCHGYVQGVFDGFRLPGEDFCPPPGTTRATIVGAVLEHILNEPQLRSENAATVTYAALLTAFPCR